jgi:hypothetical protein
MRDARQRATAEERYAHERRRVELEKELERLRRDA